jgi:3-oxoadipate enol-lactonase
MAQTLVLFHELGGSLDSWNGLVPLPENLKVLRADMHGAGMSEKSVRHARYWLCLG